MNIITINILLRKTHEKGEKGDCSQNAYVRHCSATFILGATTFTVVNKMQRNVSCNNTLYIIVYHSRLRLLDKYIVFFFSGRQTNTAVARRRHNVLRPPAGYLGE